MTKPWRVLMLSTISSIPASFLPKYGKQRIVRQSPSPASAAAFLSFLFLLENEHLTTDQVYYIDMHCFIDHCRLEEKAPCRGLQSKLEKFHPVR